MEHLFIVDPLASFNVEGDTTMAFMREAAARGQVGGTWELPQLFAGPGGKPRAHATELELLADSDHGPWYLERTQRQRALSEFDVVWMRKDPPYDLNYFFATHLISLATDDTLVVNDPRGLREVTEKLFVLRFPELTPETLVSQDMAELEAFRDALGGEMIIKQVDGCGGEGVFHLAQGDRNTKALLEVATQHGTRPQIAQQYIPEVREGDKRIILIEGEPVGAVLRVPSGGESRANFHVGGTGARTTLSERDLEICRALRPALLEHGILFSGIDVIGRYLTEVNVTSPTGVREINQLDGVRLERQVLDAVEKRYQQR